MACLCVQCAAEFNSKTDFPQSLEGTVRSAMCDGCGPTIIDPDGRCIASCTRNHDSQYIETEDGNNWRKNPDAPAAVNLKGESMCDNCGGVRNVRKFVDGEGNSQHLCGSCRYSAAARVRESDEADIAATQWRLDNEKDEDDGGEEPTS